MKDLVVALIALSIFLAVIFVVIPFLDGRYFQERRTLIFPIKQKTRFLPGLSSNERNHVFEHVFQLKKYQISQSETENEVNSSASIGDIEEAIFHETDDKNHQYSSDGEEHSINNKISRANKKEEAEEEICAQNKEELTEEEICAICLEPFIDSVTSGSQCSHLYHKTCIIKWMEKHDVCPFCRKDMFTVQEFESCAKFVLGRKRVEELSAY